MQYALGKICGDDDIVSEIIPQTLDHKPRNNAGTREHMPAKEIKGLLAPKQWNEYFKFCFVRNPFDKMVSEYFFRSQDGRFKKGSFKQFCIDCSKGVQHFPRSSVKYLIDDEIAVDFIGRFESLKKDFDYVCKKLNPPSDCQLPEKKLKHIAGKSHYSTYYDTASKEIVSNHY